MPRLSYSEFILGLVKNFLKDARGTSREVVRALGALSAAAGGGDVVNGAFDVVLGGGGDRGAGGNDAQIDDDGSDGRDENYFKLQFEFFMTVLFNYFLLFQIFVR